jgi:hypothetical protein
MEFDNSNAGLRLRLQMLQGVTPEQRARMVAAGLVPERLREFERSRNAEESMLERQADQARQFATNLDPVQANANTGTQVAGLVANALRMFGGQYMAGQREDQLRATRGETARQHEDLMHQLGVGRTAAKDAEELGLSGALKNYSPGVYGT